MKQAINSLIVPALVVKDVLYYNIREFKQDVYSRRQTAKITSEFVFFSSNP